MTTAGERRELHERLVRTLGERAGDTMIEVLAQMATREDLAPLATRRDLEDLETRIGARFDREAKRSSDEQASVRGEIAQVREDMATQLASVRGEIAQVREDMASQFGLQRREIATLVLSRRTVVLTVVATVAGLAAAFAASVAAVVALA